MAPNSQSVAGSPIDATARKVVPASGQKGERVRNFAGQDLGKVDDFVLDLDAGRIAYVVISVGGFLGIGDKLFAVPWELFSIRADDHEFYLDVDKQMLLDAPSFERSKWPDLSAPGLVDEIRSHYAQKPYWNSDITDAGDYVGDDRLDKPDRDRI